MDIIDRRPGSITLNNREVPYEEGLVIHQDLQFFVENPRIYTIMGVGDSRPTQEEIFDVLKKMDHVKKLIQSIKRNGGLHDPIIVKDNVVIEGNSRLAAYRELFSKDPVRWSRLKCIVLPDNIDEDLIFSLLGELHIIGKKDWAKFEQAGYIYRRYKNHNVTAQNIASEISMSTRAVNKMIQTYELMLEVKESDINRWSYYEEYLKIKNIGELRDEYPKLDEAVSEKIKIGEIEKAADVRDKLKVIMKSNADNIDGFINGDSSFEHSYEVALRHTNNDTMYQKLKKFFDWISDYNLEHELRISSEEVKEKCYFEIDRIKNRLIRIESKKKS